MSDNVKITVEERSAPQLRKLARALLSLVQRQSLENETTKLTTDSSKGADPGETPGASS